MYRKIHPLVGLAAFAAGTFALSSASRAVVLLKYDFGTATEANLNPSTTGAGVTSTAIGNADGLEKRNSGITYAGSSGPRVLGWQGLGNVSGSLSEALDEGQFFTFSLTPIAGQKMDLTNITFFANTGATTGVARTFVLQVSTDGADFATVGTSAMPFDTLTSAALFDIPLSSYSNITTQTTFRMAFHDAANDGAAWGTGNWVRMDDITVNGVVSPVPEPSAALIGALGAVALFRRKR